MELVKNPREASDDNIAFVIINPEESVNLQNKTAYYFAGKNGSVWE